MALWCTRSIYGSLLYNVYIWLFVGQGLYMALCCTRSIYGSLLHKVYIWLFVVQDLYMYLYCTISISPSRAVPLILEKKISFFVSQSISGCSTVHPHVFNEFPFFYSFLSSPQLWTRRARDVCVWRQTLQFDVKLYNYRIWSNKRRGAYLILDLLGG